MTRIRFGGLVFPVVVTALVGAGFLIAGDTIAADQLRDRDCDRLEATEPIQDRDQLREQDPLLDAEQDRDRDRLRDGAAAVEPVSIGDLDLDRDRDRDCLGLTGDTAASPEQARVQERIAAETQASVQLRHEGDGQGDGPARVQEQTEIRIQAEVQEQSRTQHGHQEGEGT